jgi:hypothetical protein
VARTWTKKSSQNQNHPTFQGIFGDGLLRVSTVNIFIEKNIHQSLVPIFPAIAIQG